MVELRGQIPLASSLFHHCHCLRDVPSLQQKPCVWPQFQHVARKTASLIPLSRCKTYRLPLTTPSSPSSPMLYLLPCSSVPSFSRLSPSLCHLQPHCYCVISFNVPFSLPPQACIHDLLSP